MPMGKQSRVLHGLHSRDQSVDALFEFVDAALFRIVCALQIGDLSGHREGLKYAHENGCPWDEDTCEAATEDGHLGCLKYAHENGCPWDESACEAAARCGHLECLKYAHENGCPWDEWVCHEAAKGGHLECLKYAHENRCPTLGDDVLAGIMRNLGHHAAARSYLDSIRGPRCPIESVMATLDEVATLIPDQKYKDMADGLQQLHREKERRRHHQ